MEKVILYLRPEVKAQLDRIQKSNDLLLPESVIEIALNELDRAAAKVDETLSAELALIKGEDPKYLEYLKEEYPDKFNSEDSPLDELGDIPPTGVSKAEQEMIDTQFNKGG